MENIERNNESRHVLYTRVLGEKTIQEPKGWSNDTKSYDRDKKSRGIISKTTIELEFFGDASDWLTTVFYGFGIQEKVYLSKYEKDTSSLNENWILKYVQQIDMSTFKEVSRTGAVTVKASQGGIYKEISNRASKKYDFINTLSADGVDIGTLKTYPFQPQPRGIFRETLLEDSQNGYRINSKTYESSTSQTSRTIPLKPVYNSDKENIISPSNSYESLNNVDFHDQNYGINTPQSVGDQIVWRADAYKKIKFKLTLKFKINKVSYRNAKNKNMWVELRRSVKSGDNDLLSVRSQLLSIPAPHNKIGQEFSLDIETEEVFQEGESLSVVFATEALLGTGAFVGSGYMDVYLDVSESRVLIQDETVSPPTLSRCVKPFDLFERSIAKMLGQNGLFRSSVFGEGGEYENFVVDNGFWARGFPDSVTENNGEIREIQFNTGFNEIFESFNYLEPLCWFVEISGKKEVVRVEKATHTMKNFIGITLDSVDKIENEASPLDFFSSVVLGHKKSLDYEEINGLDEPNGKSEFGTYITENESEYSVLSDFRFDPVGYELIRRFQYINFPKEDTPRDSDIWIHDAKWNGYNYVHNLWGEHFDAPPKGVFDPETAWNLRLSPMNRLYYGHGYSVTRGLYHSPDSAIRFNSSNANKNLITTINGVTLHEGGDNAFLLVKNLSKPRVEATKVTLTFKITQEIEKQLNGTTSVDGEEVPNFFGLVRYTEKGEANYGRIVKLDADEESKLTIIKARI